MTKLHRLFLPLCLILATLGLAAPTVTLQGPARNVLAPGESGSLSVSASGSGGLSYQWLRKGKAISGATGSTLAITSATYADGGWYLCDVTDANGTTRSKPIFVIVAPTKTQTQLWNSSQNTPFSDSTDLISIARSVTHSLALHRGGGLSLSGPGPQLPESEDYVQVGVGQYSSLGLRSDGSIIEIFNGYRIGSPSMNGLTDVVAIASGDLHALALKSDGSVTAWGNNAFGQCSIPVGLNDVVAIACTYSNSYALKNDGTLVIWGSNTFGMLSQSGMTGVVEVSASIRHFLALKTDGSVVAFGDNSGGQCNIPVGLSGVVSVAAGSWSGFTTGYSLALKQDGTVIGWGYFGGQGSLSLQTNSIAVYGQDGLPLIIRDASADTAPIVALPPASGAAIEAQPFSLFVTASGAPLMTYQWRKNGVEIVGATSATLTFPSISAFDAGSYDVVVTNYLGSTTSAAALLTVTELPGVGASDPQYRTILPGESTTLIPSYTGPGAASYQWFHNGRPLGGETGSSLTLASATLSHSGYYFADISDSNGVQRSPSIFVTVAPAKTQVRAWGGGAEEPAIDSIVAIAANADTGLGLKRNGVITKFKSGGPPLPVGLSGVVMVAGDGHGLALLKDGTVTAWGGDNYYGQATVPVGLSRVVSIAAGRDHSLALKSDGTVVAWGSNAWNQCNVPNGLSHVVAIYASDYFSLAIKDDGKVVKWGSYSLGAAIEELMNIGSMASYPGYHLLFLRQNGSVTTVGGSNEYGQTSVPPDLTQVISIAAGAFHNLALRDNGTVVAWGRNLEQQSAVPENLADVFRISAGITSSYAIRDATSDAAPTITQQPAGQDVVETGKITFAVSASGPGPYSYQWRKNGVAVTGATSATLKLVDLALDDAGTYDVVVTNYVGSTVSEGALLTVNAIPVVTNLSAVRQVVAHGQSTSLSVTATGTGVLNYQWTHDGLPIIGATGAALVISNFTRKDAGYYVVHVTDNVGTRISKPFFLIFEPGTGPTPVTQIRGWGGNYLAQINVPEGLSDAVAVGAREYNALALRANGTAVAWGTYVYPVPNGMSGLVSIAVGNNHVVALKSDGSVVAWGTNENGQADVPDGLTDVVAVACSGTHSLALKSDGTVVAWGAKASQWFSPNGQADVPSGLRNVVAIAASAWLSMALRSDGTIVSWGGEAQSRDQLDAVSDVRNIVAGNHHVLLLKKDGEVATWSLNQATLPASLLPEASGALVVAAGAQHSLALGSDGKVIGWMQPGAGNGPQGIVPDGLPDVFGLAAGQDFSLALRDASSDAAPSLSPLESKILTEDQSVSWSVVVAGAGPYTYQWRKDGTNIVGATGATLTLPKLLLADAGSYDVVVTNYKGSTTSNAAQLSVLPLPVVSQLSPTRQVLEPGQSLNLSVSATGTGPLSYQWYRNGRAISGATTTALAQTNLGLDESGWYAVDITDANGTRRSRPIFVRVAPLVTKVIGWGSTNYNATAVSAPNNDIVAVAAGGDRSLALLRSGAVLRFGATYTGEAEIVAALQEVVAISVGDTFSMALKADGTVVAWGNNSSGQTTVPPGLSDVVAISAGGAHALALTSSGDVIAWGGNSSGQSAVPNTAKDVVSIAAGAGHSLALKHDGTVVAWGWDTFGKSTVPDGLSEVVAIAAGADQSLALRQDGTVVGWGSNAWHESTVPAGENKNVMGVAAGFQHSYLLKRDGTLYGWGSNIGYMISSAPANLTGVYAHVLNSSFSLALVGQSSPAIFSQPAAVSEKEQKTVLLSVGVTGLAPLSYQWRKNGALIPGATSANYIIEEAALGDTGDYDVVITNSLGSTTSKVAAVTVLPVPVVTRQSALRNTRYLGEAITFNVSATGTGEISYQWFHNGLPMAGATSAGLTIGALARSDSGWYVVDVTDDIGTRRSKAMFLEVAPPQTEIVIWGDTSADFVHPPQDINDVVSISSGQSAQAAVRRNGRIFRFGHSLGLSPADTQKVSDLTDVVAVVQGPVGLGLALRSDGTVVTWGRNDAGLNSVPVGLKDVVQIAAGAHHALALKSNGKVVAWGDNFYGQCDVPADLSDVVAIVASSLQSAAIKSDGTIIGWGNITGYYVSPPYGLSGVSLIKASGLWMALMRDGTVVEWGGAYPVGDNQYVPRPDTLGSVSEIANSGTHSLALKQNGVLVGWGSNIYGPLTFPSNLSNIVSIGAGWGYSMALVDVTPPNAVEYLASTLPASFNSGESSDFAVEIKNIGTQVWGANHRLVLKNAAGDQVATVTVGPVARFATVTTNLTFTAPLDAGTHTYTLQAEEVGVGSFGEAVPITFKVVYFGTNGEAAKVFERVVGRVPLFTEVEPFGTALSNGSTQADILADMLKLPEYLAREKERAIRLYYATFSRMPDQGGLYHWANVLGTGAMSPTQVATAFAQSQEFLDTYGSLGNEAYITQLYRNTLGRDPDAGGLAYWVGQMNAGLTRGQMLLAFADSQEFADRMAPEIEVVRLYHLLFDRMPTTQEYNNWRGFVRGYDQTETILSSAEFSTLHPSGLTNAQYVQAAFQGFLLRGADQSTQDTFSAQLGNSSLSRAELIHQIMDSGEFRTTVVPVTRHYLAVFLRAPDLVGSTHWTNQMRAGLGFTQLSQVFADSAEFASSYAGLTDTQFVSQMYLNILGRPADAGGLAHWVNLFATGQSDEAGLLLSFVLSWEAGWRFAPDIRTIGHYQAFYGRSPTNTELTFWKDYLTNLPTQFRQELLESAEFNELP